MEEIFEVLYVFYIKRPDTQIKKLTKLVTKITIFITNKNTKLDLSRTCTAPVPHLSSVIGTTLHNYNRGERAYLVPFI